jgi:hypothetical protein
MNNKQARLATLSRQAERVQRRRDMLEQRNRQLWLIKLGTIFLCILIIAFALSKLAWLAIPVVIIAITTFVRLSNQHSKVNASFLKYNILQKIKHAHIARMQLDWENIPAVTAYDVQTDHPFNIDLDITGERSLHQLMNTGVSVEGQRRLSTWLLDTTPKSETIRERQDLVHELTSMTLFREKLLLNSLFVTRYITTPLEGQKLLLWLEAQDGTHIPRSTLIIPTILSLLTICSLLLFVIGLTSPLPFIIFLLVSLGWYLWTRRKRGTLSTDASYIHSTFGQLETIFEFLEKYPYGQHHKLKKLCAPFFSNPAHRPSILLHRLSWIAHWSIMENAELIALLVNAFVPWDITVAYLLDHYRERIAQLLPTWLEIWYQLEALSSLANFAYLNPDYITPEIDMNQTQATTPYFQARGIGHPLIEDEKKVVNDFALGSSQEIMLITGSNMAGKSSFLRTIGINLILAYAGAVVNATTLKTSIFEIHACIKVTDSMVDGYSYFYAEVRRLKAILTKLQTGTEYPIFFFIDEIFKGTNNRERLIGSISYIQALINKHCVGAISTHDLELVRLSEMLPQIKNYHFREEIIAGQMVFDYKLREGPSPTTNALKIMELEGLPINYQIELSHKV